MFGAIRQLKAARRERQLEKLTLQAADLNEDQDHDLLVLQQREVVQVFGSGISDRQLSAEIVNLIRRTLRAVIRPGTFFVAEGQHQHMVTRCPYSVTLPPCTATTISIDAASLEASRPTPTLGDRFSGAHSASKEIRRFLEATQDARWIVVQAGLWALTDNYSEYDIRTRLAAKDPDGDDRQGIAQKDFFEAKRILDKLDLIHRL